MLFQVLDGAKKKRFIEQISYLGVKKIPYMLIKTGEERIRAFSGQMDQHEINDLWRLVPIEGIGLYFGKQILERKTGRIESRLSIDALHVLKEQITKNILELDEEQKNQWFYGQPLKLTDKQQEELKEKSDGEFFALKFKGDFIGSGKLGMNKTIISNFLPKERRVKN